MLAALYGRPADRVPWTTLADDATRSVMPLEFSKIPAHDFYRKIGCDILQFGGYSIPFDGTPKYPFKKSRGYKVETRVADGYETTVRKLGKKELTGVSKNSHPVKYAVENAGDLSALLSMKESEASEHDPDADVYGKAEEQIGRSGLYAPIVGPSPVQELIEYECGAENFYALLQDETETMETLIDTMHRNNIVEYGLIADYMPYECVIPVENTSSLLVSPSVYKRYSQGHMRDFADIMHSRDKKAVVHMCGHLKNLLSLFAETGMDGIHTLTPPVFGDCEFDEALDALGENLIIVGTLDGGVFQNPRASRDDIIDCVRRTLTPRILASNFILLAAADGMPTELWRFEAVRDAVEEYGKK